VLRALEILADYPENRALIITLGPMELALCIASHSNPRPAPVARVLSLVAKLCEVQQLRDKTAQQVSEEDVIEMVVKSLGIFWNHPSVVIPSCTIIAAMAKDGTPKPSSSEESSAVASGGA
jgi:hypothetical protein